MTTAHALKVRGKFVRPFCRRLTFCAILIFFIVLAITTPAQEVSGPQSLTHDWSHRHVIYTGVGVNPRTANAAARDPRALSAFLRTTTAQQNSLRGPRGRNDHAYQVDWAFSMGAPNAQTPIAANQSPATFAADFNSPSCTNDYLVMPINIAGGGNANLIGVNQLYSNSAKSGFCNTVTGPTVLFAYQTGTGGGANATSVGLSLDGTKIVWVENSNPATLHVLAWKNEGTVAAPIPGTCCPPDECWPVLLGGKGRTPPHPRRPGRCALS